MNFTRQGFLGAELRQGFTELGGLALENPFMRVALWSLAGISPQRERGKFVKYECPDFRLGRKPF